MSQSRPYGIIFITAIGYFLTAQLGLLTQAVLSGPTPIWPPSGFALAMLMLHGRQAWRGVFLGSFVMGLTLKAPFWTVIGLNLANTLESFLNVSVLGDEHKVEHTFDSFAGVLRFLGRGVIPGITASATLGTAAFYLGGMIPASACMRAWWEWWVSAGLSALVVTPLILSWSTPCRKMRSFTRFQKIELLSHSVLLAVVTFLAFSFKGEATYVERSFEFILFISLTTFSVRWGLRTAGLATFFVSAIGAIGTTLGKGPFIVGSPKENFVLLQLFIAAIAFTAIVLSASVNERDLALQKAENAVKIRDEFLQIASHELNTPLTSLKLQAQFLNDLVRKDKLQTYPKDKLTQLTRTSERQIGRFAELVEDLLDVSRISAGRLRLRPEKDVDLSEIVRAVVNRYEMESKNSRCPILLDLTERITGHWDKSRIDQVVANLVSNSLKYSREGSIHISTRKVGSNACLTVKDHGAGIPLSDQKRIFNRFERGSSSTNYGGLGLGLYISREIINAHQGKIGVESQPGQGSTFAVELPLQEV